jgi:hypothetical protein
VPLLPASIHLPSNNKHKHSVSPIELFYVICPNSINTSSHYHQPQPQCKVPGLSTISRSREPNIARRNAYFATIDSNEESSTSPRKPRTDYAKADKNDFVVLPFSNTVMHLPILAAGQKVDPDLSVFSRSNIFWNIDEDAYEHNRRNNLNFEMSFSLPSYAANKELSVCYNNEYWFVNKFYAGLSALEGGDPHSHDHSGRTTLRNAVPVVLVGGNKGRKKENYKYRDPPHKVVKPSYRDDLQHPSPIYTRPITRINLSHQVSPGFPNELSYTQVQLGSFGATGMPQSMFNNPAYVQAAAPASRHSGSNDYSATYSAAVSYQPTQTHQDYGAGSSYGSSSQASHCRPSDVVAGASPYVALHYDHHQSDYTRSYTGSDYGLNSSHSATQTPRAAPQHRSHRLSPEQRAYWHHQNVRKATRRGQGWFGDCFVGSLYADCSHVDENGHVHREKLLIAQVVSDPLCIKGRAPSQLRKAAENRKQLAAAAEVQRRHPTRRP